MGNEFLVKVLYHLLDTLRECFLVTMQPASLFHDVKLAKLSGRLRPVPSRHALGLDLTPISHNAVLYHVLRRCA